jgi:hypothetical protein
MNKIKLSFNKKDYPYLDEPYDPYINWGEIALVVIENDVIVKEVFSIEWDINVFRIWLFENKKNILFEEYPIKNKRVGSIAEQIYYFYNTEENLDEDIADSMYCYRKGHGIRFGLRGVDLDDIYIGKNKNSMEISLFNEFQSWSFKIDLNLFFNEIELTTF